MRAKPACQEGLVQHLINLENSLRFLQVRWNSFLPTSEASHSSMVHWKLHFPPNNLKWPYADRGRDQTNSLPTPLWQYLCLRMKVINILRGSVVIERWSRSQHSSLCIMAGWGNGCNWEEIFISPDGVNVNQMPGFPRPSAEKIPASLAANCRAADFTRYFPDFHSRPSAHPFSAPLGKSKQQMMTPQEAIYF